MIVSCVINMDGGLKLVWNEQTPDTVSLLDGYGDDGYERVIWSLTQLKKVVDDLDTQRQNLKKDKP